MKKIYSIVAAGFLLTTGASAQTIIFSEDFQGNNGMPSNFTLFDVDAQTPATSVSYVNAAWISREDFVTPNVADSMAVSTSWYTPAGTADDWMWTPAINLTTNNTLTWRGLAPDQSYADGYEVRILTAAPTTGNIASSSILLTVPAELGAWTPHSVDLQAAGYSNQTVYIGFRNNSTDKFLLFIDDIQVAQLVNFDARMVSANRVSEYTRVPLGEGPKMNFSGSFDNNGVSAVTNVVATANVYNSANTLVYTASSTPLASLAPAASGNFTIAPFIPGAVDTYHVSYSVSTTETDGSPANNTLIPGDTLWVTDTVYGRDHAARVGALGIGAGNGGFLGQQYVLPQAANLTSITGVFGRPYSSYHVGFAVFSYNNGMPGATPIAVSSVVTLPMGGDTTLTLPLTGGPVSLPADTFVITAVEVDSTLVLGQTTDNFTLGTTWVIWPTTPLGTWGHNEDFGSSFAKPYMLRGNFGQFVGINDAATTDLNVSLYPNPANGIFTLTLDLGQQADVSVRVYNTLGEEVKSINLKRFTSGTQQVDLGTAAPGVYMVKVSTADGVKVLPVVIR